MSRDWTRWHGGCSMQESDEPVAGLQQLDGRGWRDCCCGARDVITVRSQQENRCAGAPSDASFAVSPVLVRYSATFSGG